MSDPKLLRTVLRDDVYDRLHSLALSLQTGREHWDFGVAIERLLDVHDIFIGVSERVAAVEARLDIAEMLEEEKENTLVKEQSEREKYGLVGSSPRRDK